MVLAVHLLMRTLVRASTPCPARGEALLNASALLRGGSGLRRLSRYALFVALFAGVKDLCGRDGSGHCGSGSSRNYSTVRSHSRCAARRKSGLLVGAVNLLV